MHQTQWTAVDDYLEHQLIPQDAVLDAILKHSDAAGLPSINVAPNQGKMLMLMAQSIQAQRILEVGTLGGYSTVWLARALPKQGRLITLEIDPHYATVARQNFAQAGYQDLIELRLGSALESLEQLAQEGLPPFDFIFIDADKENNTRYFEWALQLVRVGGIIIVDNVVRSGAVIEADSPDSRVQGVRRLMERIAQEPRVQATAIQTVGSKGYDGFALIHVIA